jgi:hypothetical protein
MDKGMIRRMIVLLVFGACTYMLGISNGLWQARTVEAAKDCTVPAEWGDAVSITHVDRGPGGWFVLLFQAEDGTVRALGADRDCRGKDSMLELPRK